MTTPNVGPTFGAIFVDRYPQIARSVEVARMWVENEGPASFFISAGKLETPEMFGMLMHDCIRHAARAFAVEHGICERDALDKILERFNEERDGPSAHPVTIQDGSGAPN